MLNNLDKVNWKELDTAYGDATFIPGLLREVAVADESRCKELLSELGDKISHQGDVYESTVATIPFLIELLANERVSCCIQIANRIIGILSGGDCTSELYEHLHLDNPTTNDLHLVEQAYLAAQAGYDTYAKLLDTNSPDLRVTMVEILSLFSENISSSFSLITEAIQRETDAKSLQRMLSTTHCMIASYKISSESLRRLEPILYHIIEGDNTPGPVQLSAIEALSMFTTSSVPSSMKHILLQALVEPENFHFYAPPNNMNPDEETEYFQFRLRHECACGVAAIVHHILKNIGQPIYKPVHEFAPPPLVLHQAYISDISFTEIAKDLVSNHFSLHDQPDQPTYKQLVVIAMLLNNLVLWHENNGRLMFLEPYRLPQTYDELKSLLATSDSSTAS